MSTGALIAKLASVVLSDERGRKVVGWLLVAVFSPLILLIALLCSLGSGSANHNNAAVDACFYGGSFSAQVPVEYQTYVTQMRSAFSVLDTSISSVNAEMENGSLDPTRIKAIFYVLCFGDDAPSQRAANRFVECFYTTEERTREVAVLDEDGNPTYDEDGNAVTEEETYTVALPCSLATAYANLASELGRSITEDDHKNIDHIYKRIAGGVDSGVYGLGDYERGTGYGVEIDVSGYIDPGRKNAADLATYAIHAWEQGWGYVWGTCGWVLTDSLFESKLNQYPDGVGDYIAVLIGGNTFKWKLILRDEELISMLIPFEEVFWGHVQKMTPPPLDGSDASARFVSEHFPNSVPRSAISLPAAADDLLIRYEEACEQLEAANEQKQESENKLKQMLGENEIGTAGNRVVTWKSISQERLDSRTLKAEHPTLYSKYLNKTSYRRFSVRTAG